MSNPNPFTETPFTNESENRPTAPPPFPPQGGCRSGRPHSGGCCGRHCGCGRNAQTSGNFGGVLKWLLKIFFICLLFIACFAFVFACFGVGLTLLMSTNNEVTVTEKVLSGTPEMPHRLVIIPIEGTIYEKEEGFVRQAIRQAYEDEKVAAIVLRVNSPGGTISGSDYYYSLLKDMKETQNIPITVSMGPLATSGGYYVSMVGDKIFAERSTITGSIGVICMLMNASGLCEKIGVQSNYITSGPNKGMGDFTKPMSDEERAIWDNLVQNSYQQFLEVVREGRPQFLPENRKEGEKTLEEIADGRIYTAQDALELGLIDGIGFLDEAIQSAMELANISEDNTQVIRYKRDEGLSDILSGGMSDSEGKVMGKKLDSMMKTMTTPNLYYVMPGTFPAE